MAIADLMLEARSYRVSLAAREAFLHLKARMRQPLAPYRLTTTEPEEILANRALKQAGLPAEVAA